MFEFTTGKPLPSHGLFGVSGKFSTIFLQQTGRCHNRCIFCGLHDTFAQAGSMSLEDLEFVLHTLPPFTGKVGIATDGESLLLNDLPERCALIKKFWPRCTISMTSSFNIDRGPEFLQRLFDSGLHSLKISCYAHSKEDYERIHGLGFEALCNNIRHLKNLTGVDKSRIFPYAAFNAHVLFDIANAEEKQEAFLRLAKESGLHNFGITHLHSWNNQVPYGARGKRDSPYPCSVVWGVRADTLNVRWNLDIVPCCLMASNGIVLGNLREMPVAEIFNSDEFAAFYHKHWAGEESDIPICSDCMEYRFEVLPEEQARLAAYRGQQWAGREVYFWGAGQTYREYGIFFSQTKPQAMLIDSGNPHSGTVDGIPVRHPAEVLEQGKKLPIVIFAQPGHSYTIIAKILKQFPRYTIGDTFVCPPDTLNMALCEAKLQEQQ